MLLGWNLFSIQTFGHEFIEWIRVAMAVPGFWAMSMTAWCFRSVQAFALKATRKKTKVSASLTCVEGFDL